VTDSEAFADLVRLKRQLYDLSDEHAQWCVTLPPALEMAEEQHDRMRQTQAQMTELAMRIHQHRAFEGLDQMRRYELDRDASKAARGGSK